MKEAYVLKMCNCPEAAGCVIFKKFKDALNSLPNGSIPLAFFKLRFSVSLEADYDYETTRSIGVIDGNTTIYDSVDVSAKLSCQFLKGATFKQVQVMLVRMLCSIEEEEEDHYLSFFLDKEACFKEGFETGLQGDIPRLTFDIPAEEQIYNDGYEKGLKAGLVRAVNRK
jgi:hypothetical protein